MHTVVAGSRWWELRQVRFDVRQHARRGISCQACCFIRLRSRVEISASYGEMSRRSGEAAEADNHSDISQCL